LSVLRREGGSELNRDSTRTGLDRDSSPPASGRLLDGKLQTSDEQFRLLVEGVKDYAIFMLDPAGYVATWNPGAERIKGYRAEEIVGRHFSAFYQDQDVAVGKPARGLALAEREGRFEDEGWRVRKDGSRFWASVLITALRDESGRLRGFAKVTRDITDRKRIEDQLLEAERRETAKSREVAASMAVLEETKSQFLNLASHELRTPVSLIRGYASLFEAGDLGALNERGQRAVAVLRTQAQQLNALVGQMLQAAQIQEGVLNLHQEELDLGDITEEAAGWIGELATADHGLVLRRPAEPVLVLADRRQLLTILHNLLDNAVKYSPNGGEIVCEVRAHALSAEVKIQDSGLGIAPEQHDQLFRRFGRIVTSETAEIKGAGLGLYLARELARLQGGDITVESARGRGSTFTLRLPLASA
jgi:PAS domain S-box-containing protein